MIERLTSFLQRHPRLFDALVTAIWLFLTLTSEQVEDGDSALWYTLPVFAVAALALFWRRRFPMHVFGLNVAIVLVLTAIDAADPIPAALLCATYSLAAWARERRYSIAAFTGFVVIAFATVLFTEPEFIPDTLFFALMLTIAWVFGDSLRTRRAYQQSVLDRAERAEALRDSLAQQAVAEERTRIARDLHDVVAHSMSLMVVQAGAARRVAMTDPGASVAALEAIESVGRNSLDEMRRILGVLRGDDDKTAMAPQPDIAAIEPLAEEFRAAGLPVTISSDGEVRPLAASIELTAFRIVQESLTNTLKHAGASSATVLLDFGEDSLRLVVEDTGGANKIAANPAHDSPKGLIGMRERVAAFGGDFAARPRLAGGYHVSATLPLTVSEPTEGTS